MSINGNPHDWFQYWTPSDNLDPILRAAEKEIEYALESLLFVDEDMAPAIVEAYSVTRKSRQEEYAHPAINFTRTALRWTNALQRQLTRLVRAGIIEMTPDEIAHVIYTPLTVAEYMVEFKHARREEHVNKDSLVDSIGYEDCYDRILLWLVEKRYASSWKAATHLFDGWDVDRLGRFLREIEMPEQSKTSI